MQKVHNADLGRNYVRCSQPRNACAPESCARLACATHRRIPQCGSQRHCRRRMRTELPRLPISLRQQPPPFGPRPHAANGSLQPPLCGTLNVWSLRWGYPMPSDGKLVFNTRLERAPFSALWSDSFEKRRCIVPVMAFYESSSSEYALNPTGRKVKQTYRFGCGKPAGESSEENLEAAATEHESSVETRPLLLGGIWQDDRFSIVTTEPNEAVRPVHDRMPLALSMQGALAWLAGDAAAEQLASSDMKSTALYPAVPEQEQLTLF